jgi:CBS domain containing-hemolysin-like protein
MTAFVLLLIALSTSLTVAMTETGASTTGYMNRDVAMLLAYVLLALILSFLCSIAEAVILSITPSYIAGLQEKRPKRGAILKQLKQDKVDQSLAAILTLNTIAHTIGAIGAGAKATVIFGSAWFGVFSAVMTLMILFLSEILPKTLGVVFWPKLAGATAIFVRGLILVLYPLVWASERFTRLITRGKSVHVFTREEFIAMAGLGGQGGQLAEHESRVIRNLFRFGSLQAKDIMTPRTVILALKEDMTVQEALDAMPDMTFSRLPLYRTTIDEITGFILKDYLLMAKAQGRGEIKLENLKREIRFVIGEMPLSSLLEFLLDHRQHIVIVVGEYGETRGLVTLEDVVETLLGMEIVDEIDKVEDMQAMARQQWTKRAKALGLEVDA